MATEGGGVNESQLVRAIKAHIERGDKAAEKSEQHYIAAGQYLKQLKDNCPDQRTFLEKVEKEIGIGKSRTYELLQIGDGRKTVAELRADTAKRVAKHEQSCPLTNGQNADGEDIEQSLNEDGLDDAPLPAAVAKQNDRATLLMNCAVAGQIARQELSYQGPIDNEIRRACRQTADAWIALANALERKSGGPPNNDDGLDIPEYLRRAPKAAAS